MPDGLDIQPLLDDAKCQLRDEADYLKEAEFLQAFGELLGDDERFLLPQVLPELTHRNVLAMTYASGSPIDSIIAGDKAKIAVAAERLGFSMGEKDTVYRELVLDVLMLVLEPLRDDVAYDFARSTMARDLSTLAEDVRGYRDFWRAPPIDAVYFHRKVAGMYLLATRLKARVNVHQLVQRWLT